MADVILRKRSRSLANDFQRRIYAFVFRVVRGADFPRSLPETTQQR